MIERLLREHVEGSDHPFAVALRQRGGGEHFEPRPLPPEFWTERDVPSQCLAVALNVSRLHGLEIVFGFAAPAHDGLPRAHCFNLDHAGRVVDVAWRRGPVLGYLGYRPNRAEIAVLAIANAREIATVASTLGLAD